MEDAKHDMTVTTPMPREYHVEHKTEKWWHNRHTASVRLDALFRAPVSVVRSAGLYFAWRNMDHIPVRAKPTLVSWVWFDPTHSSHLRWFLNHTGSKVNIYVPTVGPWSCLAWWPKERCQGYMRPLATWVNHHVSMPEVLRATWSQHYEQPCETGKEWLADIWCSLPQALLGTLQAPTQANY